MYQKIHEYLLQGHLVITPNDRLARAINNSFLEKQKVAEVNCFSIFSWLKKEYDKISFGSILLNNFQKEYLWHQLLYKQDQYLLHSGMESLSLEAWDYCKIYNIDWHKKNFAQDGNYLFFARIADQFTQQLNAQSLITNVCLIPYLLSFKPKKQNLVWYGFDILDPKEQELFNWHFSKIIDDLPCQTSIPVYYKFANIYEELQAINDWIINNQNKKLAVIAANLSSDLEQIKRFFNSKNTIKYLNFSLGTSVNLIPWIREIIKFLKELEKKNEFPDKLSLYDFGSIFVQKINNKFTPNIFYKKLIESICIMQSLSIFTEKVFASEAIKILINIQKKTIFQNRAPEAYVDLMGILEASYQQYDEIWFMGLTENILPQSTKFNPFIPINLQKKYNLPHTNHEIQFQLAHQYLTRLHSQAKQCIFSYSEMYQNEPQHKTGLHQNIEYQKIINLNNTDNVDLVCIPPDLYQPINPDLALTISATVLKHQAQCPFKAFAAHRLKLDSQKNEKLSFNKADRGILLHSALAYFWQKVINQQNLQKKTTFELLSLINDSVDYAFDYNQCSISYDLSTIILTIEKKIISQILQDIINWEITRENFTVKNVEKKYSFKLDENTICNLRVDRIDELASGELIVIDYKSSLPKKPWLESEPDDPQILLYAILDEKIKNIGFIQAKNNDIKSIWAGVSDLQQEKFDQFSEEDWIGAKSNWAHIIKKLADEYRNGNITPKPKTNDLCNICSYPTLCRYPFLKTKA